MFRYFCYGLVIGAAMAVTGSVQALDRAVRQVDIAVVVAEVDRDLLTKLPKSRDFSSIATLSPAVAGVADQPINLVPSGVPSGSLLPDSSIDQVLESLQAQGLVVVLDSANAEYGSAQQGFVNIIERRKDITATSEDGTRSYQFNAGFTLDIEPGAYSGGAIDYNVRLTGDYVEFKGGNPVLDSIRIAAPVELRSGQTLVISGLFDEDTRAAAARLPTLGDVPTVGTMFRSPGFLGGRTDMALFVTPTIQLAGQATSGAPVQTRPPGELPRFDVNAGVGYEYQGMPSFGWLRTETGFQGQIVERPFVSEDTNFSGAGWRFGVGMRVSAPFLGKSPRISADFSYFDADVNSFTNFISADGFGVGVEDPTGSGVFIANGFGDLYDVNFNSSYEAFGSQIMLTESFNLFAGKDTTIGAGLNVRYTDNKATLSAVTNGNTLDIQRYDKITNWIVAPTVSARVSHDYGNGITAYGGVNFGLGVGFADGWTDVMVGGGLLGDLDPCATGFVYQGGLSIGALVSFDPVVVDVKTEVNYDNFNPVINYQPFDPATVDYKGEFNGFVGASIRYQF
jgi:hypothetical protein